MPRNTSKLNKITALRQGEKWEPVQRLGEVLIRKSHRLYRSHCQKEGSPEFIFMVQYGNEQAGKGSLTPATPATAPLNTRAEEQLGNASNAAVLMLLRASVSTRVTYR